MADINKPELLTDREIWEAICSVCDDDTSSPTFEEFMDEDAKSIRDFSRKLEGMVRAKFGA